MADTTTLADDVRLAQLQMTNAQIGLLKEREERIERKLRLYRTHVREQRARLDRVRLRIGDLRQVARNQERAWDEASAPPLLPSPSRDGPARPR